MKSETAARTGVVDALSAGLRETARHPWLMIFPLIIDLWLWLAPRISIAPLLQRLLDAYVSLATTASAQAPLASTQQMVETMRDLMGQLGSQMNLADSLTGGWLGVPSALSVSQVTRMTFISDLILIPAGLSIPVVPLSATPLRAGAIEITTSGMLLVAWIGLWAAGLLLSALYLRWVAASWQERDCWGGMRGLAALVAQLAVFSIVIAGAILALRVPLYFGLVLAGTFSSSPVGQFLGWIVGGVALWLTLWFLLALFFVNEAILLEHQSFVKGLARSAALVHQNFGSSMTLAALMNLLVYGFRAIWELMGGTPWGEGLAILGNAFLCTSMLVAAFAYYDELCRRALAKPALKRKLGG